jgi:hypothetical protein
MKPALGRHIKSILDGFLGDGGEGGAGAKAEGGGGENGGQFIYGFVAFGWSCGHRISKKMEAMPATTFASATGALPGPALVGV